PIFAVDEATANEIRATFILDLALVRSFGRQHNDGQLGLSEAQKQFLVALALWKIDRLLGAPFRFRSGCHLRCTSLTNGASEVELQLSIGQAIRDAGFPSEPITDVYWPSEELYRGGTAGDGGDSTQDTEQEENNEDAET